MVTIMKKLSLSRPQRLFNGIISLVLFVWILAIREHVYYASDLREHYKFELLLFLFGLYLMQAFLNKKWLNSVLITMYSILIGYVLYTYVYAFFDVDDNVMNKQNGILIKTIQTLIKLAVLFTALWFTKKTRPR